jgi:acyl-homoserine lactone acylase PvdQ
LLLPPVTSAAEITIYRDDYGVPHIYAESEEDGFYGLGYVQAQDKLMVLLGTVYWVSGRRASLEGADHLWSDIHMRRWMHLEEGRAGFERMSPQLQRNYRYYVRGVNRYLKDHPDLVPEWAIPLDAEIMVAVSRAIAWSVYQEREGLADCRRGGVTLADDIVKFHESLPWGASNGWLVGPGRTSSGAIIVASDPHSELGSGAFYEYRVHAGELHSSGYAIGPLMWQAHTRHVAWSMTAGNPDVADCYALAVDPENPRRYRFDAEWREMIVREEIFEVRGGEPVTMAFEYTRHNGVLSPVVGRDRACAYIVSTPYMHQAGKLDEEIYRMNLARDIDGVRAAMKTVAAMPQNVVIGDSSGRSLYIRSGMAPVHPEGYDFTRPVPGNSSATAWGGIHPLEDLVQIESPRQGYLQNNNVAPDAMFGDGNIDAHAYPADIFNDRPGRRTSRGARAVEVLSAASNLTFEEAQALLFDEKWISTEAWQRALRYAADTRPDLVANQTDTFRRVLDRLLHFDGRASADSAAALNYYHWRQGMRRLFLLNRFDGLLTLPWDECDFTPELAVALLGKLDAAIREMTALNGSTDVKLGDVFRVGRGETSWPLGGETIYEPEIPDCLGDISPFCERTMRAYGAGAADKQGIRRALRGTHAARLVMFSDPIRSMSLHLYGQNDDPASLHYDDQAALASQKRMKPTYFNREELLRHVESQITLEVDED